jgi:hypothetical protein
VLARDKESNLLGPKSYEYGRLKKKLQLYLYPNVELAGERLPHVEIDHFRRPVRQRRVFPDLLLDDGDALLLRVQDLGRGRPEITENVVTLARPEDVLHLLMVFPGFKGFSAKFSFFVRAEEQTRELKTIYFPFLSL